MRKLAVPALLGLAVVGAARVSPARADGGTPTYSVSALRADALAKAANDRGTAVVESPSADADGYWNVWAIANGVETDIGKIRSQQLGVNDLGWIVGDGPQGAFVWRDGIRTNLGSWVPLGVNDIGMVVGYAGVNANLWDNGTPFTLPTLGGPYSSAYSANNSGLIVGFSYAAPVEPHACFWTRSGSEFQVHDLGLVGGTETIATHVNERGWIVGTVRTTSGSIHSALWRDGIGQDIDDFSADSSEAWDVDEHGRVVGIMSARGSGAQRAFVWQDGVATTLEPLAGDDRSFAYAIDECGTVYGGSYAYGVPGVTAVKWTLSSPTCDTSAPTITCPSDVTVAAASTAGTVVTFVDPAASDDLDATPLVSCSPASGSTFPIGVTTVTCTATDESGNSGQCQFTVSVGNLLTALAPAKVWVGLKNSDDVGTKFDLLGEVLKNGAVVGSGQVDGVSGGSSGFNNAVLRSIDLALPGVVDLSSGDTLSLRLSVRVAATGHRSGTARLWFNDSAADSRFGATLGGTAGTYYLTFASSANALQLASAGGGPKKSVDVTVDRAVNGNAWKSFGTWSTTVP